MLSAVCYFQLELFIIGCEVSEIPVTGGSPETVPFAEEDNEMQLKAPES